MSGATVNPEFEPEPVKKPKKVKEIDALEQGFATKLARKFSLKATFATVAGVAGIAATAIAAPGLVPLAGAFAYASGFMMAGTGITWIIGQAHDYKKINYNRKSEWKEYYHNGQMTRRMGRFSLRSTFATIALTAGTGAAAIAGAPVAVPFIGAAAAAAAIVTAGTATVYGFRKAYRR